LKKLGPPTFAFSSSSQFLSLGAVEDDDLRDDWDAVDVEGNILEVEELLVCTLGLMLARIDFFILLVKFTGIGFKRGLIVKNQNEDQDIPYWPLRHTPVV